MSNILTPQIIWNNFDDSLDVNATVLTTETVDGITYEGINLLGRETGEGRVKIFGVFAYAENSPSSEVLLYFSDSAVGIDRDIVKLFVGKGYSVFMVDYRGVWEGSEYFTEYPQNIDYANIIKCGRYKDFVDDNAEKTSWYEWVAVGIFARKYLVQRMGNENIGLIGIRDGGEIAWKLAVARKFTCLISVCAAGWLAYSGISKYKSDEQKLDGERYRFIAGIDSQAYAPYVQCPVMLLCSTNDPQFDYDRAYDTFSRINPDYIAESVIAYSVLCDSTIDVNSTSNMFMYLDKYLKNRQVFVPQPVEITVSVDAEQNLIATAKLDSNGVVEDFGMFCAEDCIDTTVRDWVLCRNVEKISEYERKVILDIYEETSSLFVMCYAKYTNGFTIWSKMAIKKISGLFKNSKHKCRVLYTSKNNTDGFYIAEPNALAVGGIFFTEDKMMPELVTKSKGISGVYSPNGLTSFRINSPRYAPSKESVLKIDVYCDETDEVTFILEDLNDGEIYKYGQTVIGGVWQTLIYESKLFKTVNGVQLQDYMRNLRFCISCDGKYAINNVMWL